ncbi:MAG: hypothetical protein NTX91_03190 [candidate division SR1 bacterium]|nr:hypothetical protein [candidate division SR1 bacterium]
MKTKIKKIKKRTASNIIGVMLMIVLIIVGIGVQGSHMRDINSNHIQEGGLFWLIPFMLMDRNPRRPYDEIDDLEERPYDPLYEIEKGEIEKEEKKLHDILSEALWMKDPVNILIFEIDYKEKQKELERKKEELEKRRN